MGKIAFESIIKTTLVPLIDFSTILSYFVLALIFVTTMLNLYTHNDSKIRFIFINEAIKYHIFLLEI